MVFIEAVIGEVNVRVVKVLLGGLLIVLNTKPGQPLLIQIANIRADRGYQYIQSQIELFLP